MIPPKVFISYSHDSAKHKQWVLAFATTLRDRGIDAILDQWDLKPGDDLPHFMETNLEESEYAVMICTRKYVEKANAGAGGVGYEKMIMTSTSLSNISENNVIPIIREKSDTPVPTFLKTKLYIDFTNNDEIEFSLDQLLRTLLNAPLFQKPEIGKNHFKPLQDATLKKTSDGLLEVMKHVVNVMNQSNSKHLMHRKIYENIPMPRLVFDKYYQEAQKQEFLYEDSSFFFLTDKGREYVFENEIV